MSFQEWFWYIEFDTPTHAHMKALKRIIHRHRSKYQDIVVAESFDHGLVLILDGKTQSAERDEFVYHEALVHPAMILHGNPRKVLVLGGGEGATLREVLKYPSVKEAVMVDIDEDVVRVSREYLRFMNKGVFEDPRVKLVIGDALDYVFNTREKFDVVIADLSDPLAGGPSYKLYTLEFYRRVAEILGEDGVFVTQATSPTNTPRTHAIIYRTVSSVFRYTAYYHIYMASFESVWGFVIASNSRNPKSLKPETVDEVLERNAIKTRFYDSQSHIHMFTVPKHLREYIESVTEISTMNNPVYMPA